MKKYAAVIRRLRTAKKYPHRFRPTSTWDELERKIERRVAPRERDALLELRADRDDDTRGSQDDRILGPVTIVGDMTRETCSVCGTRENLQPFAVLRFRLFLGTICPSCAYDEPCTPERLPAKVLRTDRAGRWQYDLYELDGDELVEREDD